MLTGEFQRTLQLWISQVPNNFSFSIGKQSKTFKLVNLLANNLMNWMILADRPIDKRKVVQRKFDYHFNLFSSLWPTPCNIRLNCEPDHSSCSLRPEHDRQTDNGASLAIKLLLQESVQALQTWELPLTSKASLLLTVICKSKNLWPTIAQVTTVWVSTS